MPPIRQRARARPKLHPRRHMDQLKPSALCLPRLALETLDECDLEQRIVVP